MTAAPPRLLIVGAGLIGTSIGLAASASGAEVWLSEPDPGRLATAVGRGAGCAWPTGARPGIDLAVVAAPPSATGRECADLLARPAIPAVTHVCSVQQRPLRELTETGADLSRFCGGHPVAGIERTGPEHADAALFRDRAWVVCPAAETRPAAVAAVVDLARLCGARPVHLDPGRHDHLFARLSHTPQLVASALAATLEHMTAEEAALAGSGLRDTTRLADSQPQLWSEIAAANAAEVAGALRAAIAPLADLVHALDTAGDPDQAGAAVADLVRRGNRGRAKLPGKHGGAAQPVAEVRAVIDDRPGALLRLLEQVAAAGVNLEDLRVEHTSGHLSGTAALAVVPAAAAPLRAALRQAGYAVSGPADEPS